MGKKPAVKGDDDLSPGPDSALCLFGAGTCVGTPGQPRTGQIFTHPKNGESEPALPVERGHICTLLVGLT